MQIIPVSHFTYKRTEYRKGKGLVQGHTTSKPGIPQPPSPNGSSCPNPESLRKWPLRGGEMCWVEWTQVWLFVKKSQGRDSVIVVDHVIMLSGEFVTCHFCIPSDSKSAFPPSPPLSSHSPRIMKGREVQRAEGRENAQILKWFSANVLPGL